MLASVGAHTSENTLARHRPFSYERECLRYAYQVRYVRLDKDDLTIETAPFLWHDGKTTYKVTLAWKRIK